jgi:hypothetical protein
LQPELKKSAPAKISAIGFIVLIVFGNLWLVNALIHVETPYWVSYGFFTGVVLVAVGGIALTALIFAGKLSPRIENNGENDGI